MWPWEIYYAGRDPDIDRALAAIDALPFTEAAMPLAEAIAEKCYWKQRRQTLWMIVWLLLALHAALLAVYVMILVGL